ncbi:hypothetical protein GMA19_00226 [Paenibacillus polymyxa E681]|nr:hypothetical protein [Paenibacillus polymyxa]QNV55104.1 hypothetical protein GE561_00226 [Paenibacillus polymyxa E681]QNV59941.1 hypothetical protein GMA19_00226 [Paenibacillus polymyxa E681]
MKKSLVSVMVIFAFVSIVPLSGFTSGSTGAITTFSPDNHGWN